MPAYSKGGYGGKTSGASGNAKGKGLTASQRRQFTRATRVAKSPPRKGKG
jgi:hypothetical protein